MNARAEDSSTLSVPPQSVEMEQSVLGALLVDNESIDRIGELREEHFYRYDHRLIFGFITKLILMARRADALTVLESAGHAGKNEEIGGLVYLNSLAQNSLGSSNIARYAEIVVERWKLRGVISTVDEMSAEAFAPRGRSVNEIIERGQAKLEKLTESRTTGPVQARDGLAELVTDIDEQFHGALPNSIATGFTDLDRKLDGGMNDGELIIVAGRPSMGKTAFAMCVAGNVADSADNNPVLVFSMEMPMKQLNMRNLARLGGIPLSHVKNGANMTDADWPGLTYAVQRLSELPLFIDETPGLSLMEITNRSRAIKRKHGLRMIVVDYLGLMTGGDGDNLTQVIGYYSRGLKALAKQLNLPVVVLAQLNRSLETRPDKRPKMSDLRDSGAIEQDADTILFLYRDEVYFEDSMDRGTAEVIIAKQRNGETGHVRLAFIGEHAKFADLAPGYIGASRAEAPRKKKGFE
jgi:replicative DNA helicase